jgi:hypothetical protein
MPDVIANREVGFWQHHWMALKQGFAEFRLLRDMGLGTLIAGVTLGIQVWQHLIPIADWQQHKKWWVLSVVLPYIAVLGCDSILRLLRSPWLLYLKVEEEHAKELRETKERYEKALATALEQQQSAGKLKIHSAVYGTGEMNDVSVLDAIKSIPSDGLVIPVDNNLVKGRDDPAPMQPKRLVVEYSYGQSPKRTVHRSESRPGAPARLVLPEDSEISTLNEALRITREEAQSVMEDQRRLQTALSQAESKHRSEIALLQNDWSKQWKEHSEKFSRASRLGIRADWHDTTAGAGWRIFGGDVDSNRHVEVLCRIAGNLLLASPRTAAKIPPHIKAEPDPAWRWLYYIKELGAGYEPEHLGAYEIFGDGNKRLVHAGTIRNLGATSANQCLDLSAQELMTT